MLLLCSAKMSFVDNFRENNSQSLIHIKYSRKILSVLIYLFIHFVEFNFKLTTLHGWYRDTTWYRDTSAGIVSYDILWYRDNPSVYKMSQSFEAAKTISSKSVYYNDFWRSCDTEDRSNDCWKFSFVSQE